MVWLVIGLLGWSWSCSWGEVGEFVFMWMVEILWGVGWFGSGGRWWSIFGVYVNEECGLWLLLVCLLCRSCVLVGVCGVI